MSSPHVSKIIVYAFFLLSACRRGSQSCIPRYPAGHAVHCTCPCAHIILELDAAFHYLAFQRRFLASTTRLAPSSHSHFIPGHFLIFASFFNFDFARAMDIYATFTFLFTRYLYIYLRPPVGLSAEGVLGIRAEE